MICKFLSILVSEKFDLANVNSVIKEYHTEDRHKLHILRLGNIHDMQNLHDLK